MQRNNSPETKLLFMLVMASVLLSLSFISIIVRVCHSVLWLCCWYTLEERRMLDVNDVRSFVLVIASVLTHVGPLAFHFMAPVAANVVKICCSGLNAGIIEDARAK